MRSAVLLIPGRGEVR